MVEMVELERKVIEELSAKDQVRMAMHALNGWTFSLRAAGTWMAQHRDYFDQYGTSLLSCLDRLERDNLTGPATGRGTTRDLMNTYVITEVRPWDKRQRFKGGEWHDRS